MTHPSNGEIERYTDHYFNRTKRVIGKFGDARVTYAIFMRRPVVFAPRLALDWLEDIGRERNTEVEVDQRYIEGKWVGAGEPMMYITGSFFHLVDLETIFLQKLGPACVAAYNAWTMCADMPKAAFLAMDARHCAGQEMAEMMAYAASVGSARAKRKVGAVGFIGNATARHGAFLRPRPGARHHAACADRLCRLDGARGRDVPRDLPRRADDGAGRLFRPRGLRLARGLPALSRSRGQGHAVVPPRHDRRPLRRGPRSGDVLCRAGALLARVDPRLSQRRGAALPGRHRRVGRGDLPSARTSSTRRASTRPRSSPPRASARPNAAIMAEAKAPIDVVGTGSFLPSNWTETYATADIVEYDGVKRVKIGREFLHRGRPNGAARPIVSAGAQRPSSS